MIGVCLCGGGAKGAFQAGALLALQEKRMPITVLTGTSIGAIHVRALLAGEAADLEHLWEKQSERALSSQSQGKLVENRSVMQVLEALPFRPKTFEGAYVNYAQVHQGKLTEKAVDLCLESPQEALQAVRYSASLPYNLPPMTMQELSEYTKHHHLLESFEQDLEKGVYEGMNLDGGLVNNLLLAPFLNHPQVTKIWVIGFSTSLEIPKTYIAHYGKENIHLLLPEEPFQPGDTLNFSKSFLKERLAQGYHRTKQALAAYALR